MFVITVLFSAAYSSEAAVWRAAFHLQCCDVDLPGQSTQVLVFLHLDHCDHNCLELHIICEWQQLPSPLGPPPQARQSQYHPFLAGVPWAADLWWSPDNAVVGWDLVDIRRAVGTAVGLTTGWTTKHSRQGWIMSLVSTCWPLLDPYMVSWFKLLAKEKQFGSCTLLAQQLILFKKK